jgi:DNA-binding transcriptional LysR family regulator
VTRQIVSDLIHFLPGARERSFTKAAAKLSVSQCTLSYTMLDVRLLDRAMGAVAPTETGEWLLGRRGPHLDQIEVEIEIDRLNARKEKPTGAIRVVAPEYAISHVLWPKAKSFAPKKSRYQGRPATRHRRCDQALRRWSVHGRT